jgi:hypothetical protein
MKMASKGNKKYAPAELNSSDLSLGFHCNCSQTRDTIPLKLSFTNIRGRTQRVGLQETSKLCKMQLKKYSYS